MDYVIHPPSAIEPSAFLGWLVATDALLGLDVETTAISEDKKGQWSPDFALRTIQLADTDTAWVLDATNPDHRVLFEQARAVKFFVTHTDYDLRSLWCGLGLDCTAQTVDTHVLACLLNPGQDNRLKTWSRVFGPDLVDAETALTEHAKALAPVGHRVGPKLKAFTFNELAVDDAEFVRYAGLDALIVRRLHDVLTERITATKMAHLIDREQRYHRTFVRKGLRGTRLDLATAQALYDETDTAFTAARERFQLATGLPAQSCYRGDWLEAHGADLSLAPRTDGGKPSLSKHSLPMLAAENDTDELRERWAELITVSRTSNLRSNLATIITGADATGHGHPVTKTQGAKTGRASVTGIPLQTFNKKDQRLRSIIRAEHGCVFVKSDYDAVEWRVAAALSQDPVLLRVLERGEDLHDNTARALFGPNFTAEQRGIGKGLGFGTLYMGGAVTLAGQVGATVERTRELIHRLKDTYPTCFAYLRTLGERPGIRTPWGRQIPADNPELAYQLANYMIQSTAREIMVDAVLRLFDDYSVPEEWLEMCVHDEIILQVPEWAVDYATAALDAAMNITFRGVRITATAEDIGPTWGRVPEQVAA